MPLIFPSPQHPPHLLVPPPDPNLLAALPNLCPPHYHHHTWQVLAGVPVLQLQCLGKAGQRRGLSQEAAEDEDNMDPVEQELRRGQVLWFRGLHRIQTQVRSVGLGKARPAAGAWRVLWLGSPQYHPTVASHHLEAQDPTVTLISNLSCPSISSLPPFSKAGMLPHHQSATICSSPLFSKAGSHYCHQPVTCIPIQQSWGPKAPPICLSHAPISNLLHLWLYPTGAIRPPSAPIAIHVPRPTHPLWGREEGAWEPELLGSLLLWWVEQWG